MERPLPRRGARLLARPERRRRRSSPTRFTGSADLYQRDGRRPVGVDQLRHRARRLHAARPGLATTRSTTRPTSRTTATAPTTTAAGTAASRGRPTTRRSSALRERQQRNLLATLLLSQGVPMLLGGRRDGAHPGRQQQRLLPGQRDQLDRLGARRASRRRLLEFTQRLIALRQAHPVFRRRDFFGGRRRRRLEPARHLVVPPRRARDEPPRLGATGDRRALGRLPERRGAPRADRRAGEPVIDDSFILLLNAGARAGRASGCRPRRFGNRWRQVLSTADPDAAEGANRGRPAPRCRSRRGRCSCCAVAW